MVAKLLLALHVGKTEVYQQFIIKTIMSEIVNNTRPAACSRLFVDCPSGVLRGLFECASTPLRPRFGAARSAMVCVPKKSEDTPKKSRIRVKGIPNKSRSNLQCRPDSSQRQERHAGAPPRAGPFPRRTFQNTLIRHD